MLIERQSFKLLNDCVETRVSERVTVNVAGKVSGLGLSKNFKARQYKPVSPEGFPCFIDTLRMKRNAAKKF